MGGPGEVDTLATERSPAPPPLPPGEAGSKGCTIRPEEILEHSRDILCRRDIRTWRYRHVRRAFGRGLGYTPEETARMVCKGVEHLSR